LKFDSTGLIPESALVRIADHPDKGYFCYVAAFAYEGFINSPINAAEMQVGWPVKSYNNILYQRIGHANDYVYLPDGRVLLVDMTPPVTDKTPQEDLDALADPPIPQDILDRDKAQREAEHQEKLQQLREQRAMNEKQKADYLHEQ